MASRSKDVAPIPTDVVDEDRHYLAEGIDIFAVDLEASVNDWLAAMDAFEGMAPSEIAADVAVIANASRQFAAMLAEADYQMLNIDPDDPRMAAFDDGSIDEAANNIAEFCGWDLTSGFGGGDDPGSSDDAIPDNIPAVLIPPDVEGVDDNGAAGLSITSSASFEDVVAYYEDLLGSPISTDGDTVTFKGTVDGSAAVVLVQLTGDFVLVTLIVF